jgi:multimeric flavodoxin WrbA
MKPTMKILAICGSQRKGNTFSALNMIKASFPETGLKILMLKDLDFSMCRGCYSCVMRGEDKCPIKDDRDMLIHEMWEADGVVFASPTHSHMVSAPMKNFYDRFGYLAHRPQFFGKYAMSMTTCSGYGGEFAVQYMEKMAAIFGFELAPSLVLDVRPGKVSEKEKQFNKEKSVKAFKVFFSTIEKKERKKPSLNFLVPFHIFKLVSELDSKMFSADYEYYKNKKDYYYDIHINPLKTIIAKKVARKTILG